MSHLIVRVAAVQLSVKVGAQEDNLHRARKLLSQCGAAECQLAVLPEAFATGLNLPKLKEIAEPIPGPTSGFLRNAAMEERMYVAGGVVERDGEKVYSSALLFDPSGALVGRYRRIHTYALEQRFLNPGDECTVMETPIGRIGMILGYDINFPELSRLLFRQRVEILLCPTQLLRPFTKAVRAMAISRAAENCCYFVMSSSTGANTLANLTYMADSVIVRNPVGMTSHSLDYINKREIIAEAGESEGIIQGDLDITQIRREQEENPHYSDGLMLSYSRS